MKKIFAVAMVLSLTGSAFADKVKASKGEKVEVDTTHNPLTGSDTTTTTHEKEVQHADGSAHEVTKTHKVKSHKGKVKTTDSVEHNDTPAK